MSDVNKLIEVLEELPLHATVQNLLTYYPKILVDQRVPKDPIKQTKNMSSPAKAIVSPECKPSFQKSAETMRLKK